MQTPQPFTEKYPGKRHHGQKRGQAHHLHPAFMVIGNPPPDYRRDNPEDHEQRYQITDVNGSKADGLQIQPPVRHERAQGGEIEKIKAGQSLVKA